MSRAELQLSDLDDQMLVNNMAFVFDISDYVPDEEWKNRVEDFSIHDALYGIRQVFASIVRVLAENYGLQNEDLTKFYQYKPLSEYIGLERGLPQRFACKAVQIALWNGIMANALGIDSRYCVGRELVQFRRLVSKHDLDVAKRIYEAATKDALHNVPSFESVRYWEKIMLNIS